MKIAVFGSEFVLLKLDFQLNLKVGAEKISYFVPILQNWCYIT